MPKIYGGSPTVDSLREEDIAEAQFDYSNKWAGAKHSSLTVGVMLVTVRRGPQGWVGVIFDMDDGTQAQRTARWDLLIPRGREVWRDKTIWIDEMRALSEAERHAKTLCPAWDSDYEHGFHTMGKAKP